VIGVLGQRLVRRLCDHCKEPYVPAPQILQQLGIPEGRIQAFYRPRNSRKRSANNAARGLRGTLGDLRAAGGRRDDPRDPRHHAKLDLLRQAARKAGMRNLQEEGSSSWPGARPRCRTDADLKQ